MFNSFDFTLYYSLQSRELSLNIFFWRLTMNCLRCGSKLNQLMKYWICSSNTCNSKFDEFENQLRERSDVKRLLLLYYNDKPLEEDGGSHKFVRDFILTYNYRSEENNLPYVAEKYNICNPKANEFYMEMLHHCPYDIIFDRITHVLNEDWGLVTRLAAIGGTCVVPKGPFNMYNNKAFDYHVIQKLQQNNLIDVDVPKTLLLTPEIYRRAENGKLVFDLEKEMEYIGGKFPCYLKQAHGGGWQHVYKCENMDELLNSYHSMQKKHMVLQENVDYIEFVRCFIFGYECQSIVKYDPSAPLHARYVQTENFLPPTIMALIKEKAEQVCKALGYYINSVEFGITRDGKILAIDFTNETIDMNPQTVSDYFYTKHLHLLSTFFIKVTHTPFKMAIYPNIRDAFKILPSEDSLFSAPHELEKENS